MLPNKPQEQLIYGIEEPAVGVAGQVPPMCVGCPENRQPESPALPRIYSLEDPVEYFIPFVTQVSIPRPSDN